MAGQLKKFVKLLMEMGNEAKIEFTKETMHSRLLDDANCAIIDVWVNKTAFIEYDPGDATFENPVVVGVDLVKLDDIIKQAGKLSEVTLEESSGKIKVTFDGMFFKIKSVDLVSMKANSRIPNIEFPIKVEIDSVFFKSALAGVGIVKGDVVIVTEGNTLMFKSSSDDGDSFEFPITVDGDYSKTESMYSNSYIKTAGMFDGEIEIMYDNEKPIFFRNFTDEMTTIYMVAPKLLH
jgi:proliferating cell nuclear antigen